MVSNEGWTLSLVLCLQRYFLLSFIALARLSSSWALDLLISPYITSQHPCSPAGLPAPSSKGHTPLFCSLSSSQSSLLNQVGSSPPVAHPLAHGDGWAAPAVPLGFPSPGTPAFLDFSALQGCLPRDSANPAPKHSLPSGSPRQEFCCHPSICLRTKNSTIS